MTTPLRLLIVEDSEDDAALLVRELSRGGYRVEHRRVDTAEDLGRALDEAEWDVVISDHSMPQFSGTDALDLVRSKGGDCPFIFVSGTIGEEAAVAALKIGAQDYVMKNNMKRLLPAVERELREAGERRERARLERHVQHLQKFEAIGRLAGGIAHDFNNVLGAIMGWAELASDEAPAGSRLQERLQQIQSQTDSAARLTAQLLAFARRQVLQRKRTSLNVLVQEGTSLLRRVIGEHIEVRIACSPDLRVAMVDPAQIEQVLMNLCLNARDAMPDGGTLVIETRNVEIDEGFCCSYADAKPGAYVLLSVSDTGIGMDPATMDHMFEPFFTTKAVGQGTGLGLATVYGVVQQHGGFVSAYSQPGVGTSFYVYLKAEDGSPERPDINADDQVRRGSETILLAEDHDGLRQSVRETLEALGYQVILASNGAEAVQLFRENVERIDLLILDVVMPGLTGPEVYAKVSAIRPDVEAIFTTGYTSEAQHLVSTMGAGVPLLQKPCSSKTLTRAIGDICARRAEPAPACAANRGSRRKR